MRARTGLASRRAASSNALEAGPANRRSPAWQRLHRGLGLALADLGQGREELRAALALFTQDEDPAGRLIAAAALVQFIGIADDDYAGFEDAVAAVTASAQSLDAIDEPNHRLIAHTGLLVVGWFSALDDPALAAQAEALTQDLRDEAVAPAVRCCAGLAVLAFFVARFNLEGVLWVELAMRQVLEAPALGQRLAEEWHHALMQSLYECGARERAEAVRAQRGDAAAPSLPAIELKHWLAQAQIAIGEGRIDDGRAAMQRAEPLLHPRAPRPAGWWHLLQSRLELIAGRHSEALVHARLALRLVQASHFPERWMGLVLMQPGQVHMASGAYAQAVPFFERAGRAAVGTQAEFCGCLAHFARALAGDANGSEGLDGDPLDRLRAELSQGLAAARRLHWLHFFRASPRVAAQVCALGLEQQVETEFVREVIAARGLDAVRPDLCAWPWAIRVRTLGRFEIELHGEVLAFAGKVARKPLELLQFIIASGGHDVSAATVMFALWRELEGDKAKSAFNVALHRLRKLLVHDDAIQLERGRLCLNDKLVWVDGLAFEQLVDVALGAPPGPLTQQAFVDIQRAAALYGGHFLHETEDEPWQMVCRSRLASKFKRGVTRLARDAPAGVDDRGVRALLERALELDPMAEDLARELMRLLGERGEQSTALGVFERFKAASARGLGARPAGSTLALVERIRGAAG